MIKNTEKSLKTMYIKVLTVSSLNNYIKKVMDHDFILNNVNVKGEISNFKYHDSSGHLYFSIKDEFGKINAVMFKANTNNLNFMPENGMNVEVKGRVTVYPKDGSYQLYCDEIKEVGIGELYIAFTLLKQRLEKQGFFKDEHKRMLPALPRRIGIITSQSGAALRDIINVATRRNKNVDLLLYPALVQGIAATDDIIKGINFLNKVNDIDVIILARGGGSIEELWAFNEEKLANAIYNSTVPIVTGVGHETDFTIADFVSDMRAPTPSAAAEIVVPSLESMNRNISNLRTNLTNVYKNDIINKYNEVKMLNKSLEVNNPLNYIINSYNFIDNLKTRLNHNIITNLNMKKEGISKLNAVLQAHNPLNVLNKGYSVIQNINKSVINDINTLKNSGDIYVTVKNGTLKGKFNFMEE